MTPPYIRTYWASTAAARRVDVEEGTSRERQVQRGSKLEGKGDLSLDLLRAESSLATGLGSRVEIDLPEGPLSVVSRDALLKMKRLAGRAQDLADAEDLER
mgnify:CR=1 FL=1